MLILGIESSCDETAASVIEDHTTVRSNIVASQIAEHRLYGGVVPEIASRRHCENVLWVVQQALEEANVTLKDLDAVAVTYAPGLIGALLVGVNFAKGLALAAEKPLVPVHHIAGHIAANYIAHPDLKPPYLCLVASGGHSHIVEVLSHTSYRVIGRTRDDAAGECFDKCARAMGFPYPGGVQIDRAAQIGNADAFSLPKPKVAGNAYDFSFSGLKTSVVNLLHNAQQKGTTLNVQDLSAAVQQTISTVLTEHTIQAALDLGYDTIAVAGGVSANSGVRSRMQEACSKRGLRCFLPPKELCGDNGAMIAYTGFLRLKQGQHSDLAIDVKPRWAMTELPAI